MSPSLVIACVILVALSLRPGIVSIGPLLLRIGKDFDLSHTQASLLTSIPDVIMGVMALPTPWLAGRFGRDRVMIASLCLLLAAMLARACSASIASLLLTTAGVGAGIAISGALIAGFVKAAAPHRAILVMSIYGTALSLGSTLSASLTGPIAQITDGWRVPAAGWSLFGIPAIAVWLIVRRRQQLPEARAFERTTHPLPFANRAAWLAAAFFACNNFLFYALLAWIAPMYTEHGFGPTRPSLILGVFAASFMIGNPVFGLLSRQTDRRLWLAFSSGFAAIGLYLLAWRPDEVPYLGTMLVAFGLGGGFSLGMTLPLDNTRNAHEANAWNAFILTVGYLIAAGGPLLVGWLRDATGGFGWALWLLFAVGVSMLALTATLKPAIERT
jgi:MFS transporter, CP family, cyanate transporter